MLKILPYWDKVNHELAEIFQAVDIKFSFATVNENNEITRCHDWVKCRDFLGDVVITTNTEKKTHIYGFTYDLKKNPAIDKKNTTLLLKFPDEVTKDAYLNNSFLLNKYNKINNLGETSFLPTKDPLIYLVIGDPFWQKNFVTISLYTFLMKCMGYNLQLGEDWKKQIVNYTNDTPEKRYIKETGTKLDLLLENCYNIFADCTEITGYEEHIRQGTFMEMYNIHNNSGFYTMIRWPIAYNTIHERFKNYVANTPKAIKRVRKSSKKLATPINDAVLATAAG